MNKLIVNLFVFYLAIGFNFCKSDSIYLSGNGGYVSLAESNQAFTTPCTYKDRLKNQETKRYMISLDEATQNHYLNFNFTSDDLEENIVFQFDDFDQYESETPIGYSICKGGAKQIYFNLGLNNQFLRTEQHYVNITCPAPADIIPQLLPCSPWTKTLSMFNHLNLPEQVVSFTLTITDSESVISTAHVLLETYHASNQSVLLAFPRRQNSNLPMLGLPPIRFCLSS
ncbi:hypothetical protein CYY_001718 [Polysphondylium violaceum]|uniref:Transmembrane protein n=1 Tax=Polysphondylium violaceum TaxID=133409 RepID=A0A8J4VAC7_9MYCE|nr:hypothetical protein CYY_001718 [Polysphondylium violaceum]